MGFRRAQNSRFVARLLGFLLICKRSKCLGLRVQLRWNSDHSPAPSTCRHLKHDSKVGPPKLIPSKGLGARTARGSASPMAPDTRSLFTQRLASRTLKPRSAGTPKVLPTASSPFLPDLLAFLRYQTRCSGP